MKHVLEKHKVVFLSWLFLTKFHLFKVYYVLCWEDALEECLATHSSILAWRIPMDRGAWWGGGGARKGPD